jgi:hypothetical protein
MIVTPQNWGPPGPQFWKCPALNSHLGKGKGGRTIMIIVTLDFRNIF